MKLPDDFRDLLVCLSDAQVEYVVVGGFAVAHHGHVRATKDIDVFVKPDVENAEKVARALRAFGAPLESLKVSPDDFSVAGKVVQIGVPPLRIDIVTGIAGIGFADALIAHGTLDVDGRAVPVIGLDALLANKRAAGRPQDLADVAALEGMLGRHGQPKGGSVS